jgi:hypothetical protein
MIGTSVRVHARAYALGRHKASRFCREIICFPNKEAVVSDIRVIAKYKTGKQRAPVFAKIELLLLGRSKYRLPVMRAMTREEQTWSKFDCQSPRAI